MADSTTCPWCGFESRDSYVTALHIEHVHTDDSPFVIRTRSPDISSRGGRAPSDVDQQSEPSERWIKCTRRGCGQYINEANVDDHLDMHDAIASSGASTYSSGSGQISPRVLNGRGYARPRVSSDKAPSQISSARSSASSWSGGWQRPSSKARSAMSSRSSVSSRSAASQASTVKAPSEVSVARQSTTSKSAVSEKSAASNKSATSKKSAVSSKSVASSKSTAPSSSYAGSSIGPKDALKDHPKSGRLGTKELGPHAFEKAMPREVRRALENASKPSYECRIGPSGKVIREAIVYNEKPRPIPILADLSAHDPNVTIAYFCHKSVKHVHKVKCDGNFCGYWNIQMLLSYRLARIEDPAHSYLPLPNVLEIQDTIEAAWDAGTCAFGRTETGGIRNTRKWIGTHEAAAYFLHLGQPVTALSFRTSSNPKAPAAHTQLLDYVEAYFLSDLEYARKNGTSRLTQMAPIYFQRPGHSMTIVGMERRTDGERVLLVFDPSYAVAETFRLLDRGKFSKSQIATLMAPFRQDEAALARYKEYEIMM